MHNHKDPHNHEGPHNRRDARPFVSTRPKSTIVLTHGGVCVTFQRNNVNLKINEAGGLKGEQKEDVLACGFPHRRKRREFCVVFSVLICCKKCDVDLGKTSAHVC